MMNGLEAPMHRSMVQPIYLMGVPRSIFWVEVFSGILCGLFFKSFFVVAILILIHLLFTYLGQKDALFMQVFWHSQRHSRYYYR